MSEREDAHDLLPAWALDAVSAQERELVERAIERDPALAREATELLTTSAGLAEQAATTPPAALRADVLAAIAAAASADSAATGATPSRPSAPRSAARPTSPAPSQAATRHRGRWLALAAAAALAVAVPTTVAVQQSMRASQTQQQLADLEEAMSAPGARLIQADVAGGGTASAVLHDGGALFAARDLPDPGSERTYQLWVVGEEITSAGVLTLTDGRVLASAEVPDGAALAMSVEPQGGSDQPTTEPVVVLADA